MLRYYQTEAHDRSIEANKSHRAVLVVMPTGTGKTPVMATLAQTEVSNGGRALVLSNRKKLVRQAGKTIEDFIGEQYGLEAGRSRAVGEMWPIVVASVQSMANERLLAYPKDYFTKIIIDEAHHSLAPQYKDIFEHFSGAKCVGFTATPDRGDRRQLSEFYGCVAYEYPVKQALSDGFICNIQSVTLPIRVDISKVGRSQGDLNEGELAHAIEPYLDEIARVTADFAKDRKILTFLPIIETSKLACEVFNAHGIVTKHLDGTSKDIDAVIDELVRGDISNIVNSMLLTEGVDIPPVDCIIVLRPTESRPLYCQMVGRGTRVFPGKRNLLLLDFLWLTDKHDICHPATIVSPNADITGLVTDAQNGQPFTPIDIFAEEEIAEHKFIRDREKKLARYLDENKHRKPKTVDPLQYGIWTGDLDLVSYEPSFDWQKAPATEQQKVILESRGIDCESITRGYAAATIKSLNRNQNKATPKQLKFLVAQGVKKVHALTKQQASEILDRRFRRIDFIKRMKGRR